MCEECAGLCEAFYRALLIGFTREIVRVAFLATVLAIVLQLLLRELRGVVRVRSVLIQDVGYIRFLYISDED